MFGGLDRFLPSGDGDGVGNSSQAEGGEERLQDSQGEEQMNLVEAPKTVDRAALNIGCVEVPATYLIYFLNIEIVNVDVNHQQYFTIFPLQVREDGQEGGHEADQGDHLEDSHPG